MSNEGFFTTLGKVFAAAIVGIVIASFIGLVMKGLGVF